MTGTIPASRITLRQITLTALLLLALTSRAAVRAADKPAVSGLRVPEGFVIERVAAEPDVIFPMFAAFDDRGRLFVAESSGLDLYAELKAQTRKCRIRLLEDPDNNGGFRKSSIFADRLVFPMGLVWRDGKLYVADPPDLISLEANDADGTPRTTAGKRTVLLSGFGHVDNGSLHGLTFGPDGLLYMTMGRPDGYTLKRRDGSVVHGKTGALIRCRTDGADPEVLCRGFENLVEVVFTMQGDIIGTDNWFQNPSGGIRDALVHLVDGGLYPKHHDIGTPQPTTGEMLPALALFPAVALSGLEIYRGQAFPAAMHGNLFSAQHNARKVGRHVLSRHGATFRSQDFDFVTSDDPDFHPADVLEDADGSLLVLDTGSWYVHHCPTGQIRKTKAGGGIYRVRKTGVAPIADPWGLKIDWQKSTAKQLTELLDDPRPAVRDRAQQTLIKHGKTAVPNLSEVLTGTPPMSSATARQHAVWALAGIADETALPPLRDQVVNGEPLVAIAAIRALGRRGDRVIAPKLCAILGDRPEDSVPLRLAAAEALAHCGDSGSLDHLWKALEQDADRFLEHALIHALYHVADTKALEAALKAPRPRVQKAALILLDQPPRPRDQLKADEVIERVRSADAELRLTARRVLQKHPEWAEHALGLVRGWLEKPKRSAEEELGLRGLLLSFQAHKAVQDLLAVVIAGKDDKSESRLLALETMAETTLPTFPPSWVEALGQVLRSSDTKLRIQAVRTAAVLQVPQLDDALGKLSEDSKQKSDLRLEALRGVVLRRPKLGAPAFELLLAQMTEEAGPLAKLAAAEIAGRAQLGDKQVLHLLKAIRADALISPAVVLPALRPHSSETALAVTDYLADSIKGGWKPNEMELEKVVQSLPESARQKAGELRDLLRQSGERQRARLTEFEPLLSGGNVERGRAVFHGKKVACAICHRIGAEGGKVGPDLTKVGAIRAARDLLESVVVPSSTIAQGFDPYVIATADGRVINGIIARQTPEFLVVRDASGAELQLRKDKIQEMRRSATSIMPEGLERAITREELRDLLAFLRGLK